MCARSHGADVITPTLLFQDPGCLSGAGGILTTASPRRECDTLPSPVAFLRDLPREVYFSKLSDLCWPH